jgi:ABC-type lipoprotein release transport system permease subunit
MNLNNPPKLIGILAAMGCLTIVFAMGTLSESGYIGLMGLLVGYLVGNGIAARAGEPVEPVLTESRKHSDQRQLDE